MEIILKVWAYGAATAGLLAGGWLLKSKQIRLGVILMVGALAVFFGGSLNIGKIIDFSGSITMMGQKLESIDKKVEKLKSYLADVNGERIVAENGEPIVLEDSK